MYTSQIVCAERVAIAYSKAVIQACIVPVAIGGVCMLTFPEVGALLGVRGMRLGHLGKGNP